VNILARALVVAAVFVTAGCGGEQLPPPAAKPAGTAAKMVMSTGQEATATSVGGFVTVASVASVADNFNTQAGLAASSWGIPASMGSDPVGAFRMICGAGQLSYDDPIVYPGQAGKSHLHQFYGNLAANGNSDFASLRTTGNSTCGDPTNTAAVNRSGYWMPAMLDGAGNVVKPEYVAIYYKRLPKTDPKCTRSNPGAVGNCVGIPMGLRYITGYNMQDGTSDVHAFFYCQDSDDGSVKAVSSTLHDNMMQVITECPVGARLTLNIGGPDCWDGVNLDSPDHRSHVAHGSYVWDAALNKSYYRCDDAHPYHIPQMTLMAFYTVDANFIAGKWHLASDEMLPAAPAGSTFHADYWEAWSPTVRKTWEDNCIDGHLNCAGGDLGNGTVIKGMTIPATRSQLVALSSIGNSPVTPTAPAPTTTASTGSTTPIVTSPTLVVDPTSTPTPTPTPSPVSACKGKGKKGCGAG
jgi:hypothetical protein